MPDLFIPSAPSKTMPTSPQAVTTPLATQPVHPLHALTNFLKMPQGVTFDDQEPNETISLFLRRDLITNAPWIATAIILIIFPLLLTVILQTSENPFSFLNQFQLILVLFYYVCVLTYIFLNVINWFYNISLVTNQRVFDLNFNNIISKDISATKMNLISDVSFSQAGVIRTVFDYGNVVVQTAAAVDKFELQAIPRPHEVVQIIESLIGEGDKDAS